MILLRSTKGVVRVNVTWAGPLGKVGDAKEFSSSSRIDRPIGNSGLIQGLAERPLTRDSSSPRSRELTVRLTSALVTTSWLGLPWSRSPAMPSNCGIVISTRSELFSRQARVSTIWSDSDVSLLPKRSSSHSNRSRLRARGCLIGCER